MIPAFGLISKTLTPDDQSDRLHSLQQNPSLKFPIILKPDVGERGTGVAIIRSSEEALEYFEKAKDDIIVQEYVEGLEYGIFYFRLPDEKNGHIFSITDKRFISITGDGKRTFESLLIDDPRAVAVAPFFIRKYANRLFDVPAEGENIILSELGTHSRGSQFLDGTHLVTPELTREIDRISKHFEGFYFGRYDVKVPSVEDLQSGERIRVLGLNGITSEATSICDPKNGLFTAYKVLFDQWAIASKIVEQNKEAGITPANHLQVIKQYIDYRTHEKIEV